MQFVYDYYIGKQLGRMKIAPKMDENANIDDTYDDVKVLSTGLKLQQLYPTITLPKGYKGPELRIRDVIQKVYKHSHFIRPIVLI